MENIDHHDTLLLRNLMVSIIVIFIFTVLQ